MGMVVGETRVLLSHPQVPSLGLALRAPSTYEVVHSSHVTHTDTTFTVANGHAQSTWDRSNLQWGQPRPRGTHRDRTVTPLPTLHSSPKKSNGPKETELGCGRGRAGRLHGVQEAGRGCRNVSWVSQPCGGSGPEAAFGSRFSHKFRSARRKSLAGGERGMAPGDTSSHNFGCVALGTAGSRPSPEPRPGWSRPGGPLSRRDSVAATGWVGPHPGL